MLAIPPKSLPTVPRKRSRQPTAHMPEKLQSDPEGSAEANFESSKAHAKQAAEELRAAAEAKARELREKAESKAQELRTTAETKYYEFRDKAEHTYDEARTRARTLQEDGEAFIRENPTQAVCTALVAGLFLGLLMRR